MGITALGISLTEPPVVQQGETTLVWWTKFKAIDAKLTNLSQLHAAPLRRMTIFGEWQADRLAESRALFSMLRRAHE
jgi:hypothetical protein